MSNTHKKKTKVTVFTAEHETQLSKTKTNRLGGLKVRVNTHKNYFVLMR